MAEALINDPRKKLYSALVSSPDKDLAGQVKKFSYNKFNSLLDNTDFVKDLFLDISERGVVLDPKNPRSSQDPNEFISAFVQKEIPQAPPAPKAQVAPVAPPPVEQVAPPIGIAAPKPVKEPAPSVTDITRQMAFQPPVEVPVEPVQMEPEGFFEGLGTQFKRGLAQGRAIQSVNMGQLRDAAQGKNLGAIPYEQIAAANKAVKEFGQTQSDIDLATKEGWIKDAWDVVKALPGVTIESLASLGRSGIEEAIVGAGTGAAAGSIIPGLGTAAGAGLGGAASMVQSGRNLEYFGTLMQELEAKGVDITDPAKLKYGIATYGKDADKTAITRANTIAAVESFLPIAGRGAEALATRVGSKVAQKPLQAIGKGLSYEPIAGPLGGATGELAAQIASGQEIDPQAVALEAGGEGAATVAAIAKAIKSRKKPSAEPSITPESEIETVSAEELQGPGYQIAYAKTREEIPQEYRGTIVEIERPTTRLGRFGPMERLFAYRVPTETIDITAPEITAPEAVTETAPIEELPPVTEEAPATTGMFEGIEGPPMEEAAPAAPAEEEVVTEEVPTKPIAPEVVSAAPVEEAALVTPAPAAPKPQPQPIAEVVKPAFQQMVAEAAKALEKKYKKENPHSGGGLSGDSKAFDELPENAEVYVYTATTPENAEAILKGDKEYVPQLQGQGIKGQANAIYVASDPRVVSGMGKTIVGFKVKKSDLALSPEAKRSKQTLGQSIITSGTGAILKGEPSIKFIAETQERINTSAKSGNEAIAEAYYKAKADGSNPKLVRAVEELLTTPAPAEEAAPEAPAAPAPKGRKRKEALVQKPKREDFPESQSNTRTPVTQKLLDYFADAFGIPRFTDDLSKGTYIGWLQNANATGYEVASKLNAPRQAFDVIANYEKSISKGQEAPVTPAPAAPKKETPKEEKPVSGTPQEGDKVEIAPQREGGFPRNMVFKDGEWKQNVGGDIVKVGPAVQQQAQEAFGGKAEVKPAETKEGKKEPIKKAPKTKEEFLEQQDEYDAKIWAAGVVAEIKEEEDIKRATEFLADYVASKNNDDYTKAWYDLRQKDYQKFKQYANPKIAKDLIEKAVQIGFLDEGSAKRFISSPETKEGKKAEAKEEKSKAPSFTSQQSSEAATAFDKAKTSKGFDKKYGKGAYKALSDITKNFEDIMDKVSEKIKQDCII